MHKKLKADLMSLAHSILRMKNKEDVFALRDESEKIHEKLSLLAFVEEYINTTPNLKETKNALISKVETAIKTKEKAVIETEKIVPPLKNKMDEKPQEKILEKPFDKSKQTTITNDLLEDTKKVENRKIATLEEELHGTIPVEVTANPKLFEPVSKKSLNDELQTKIQIGLNDRITFVKNLFDGSQEDFNRVLSQLNTFKTEDETKKFINKMIKPDYNWAEHQELEARFMEIIERKFS